MNLLRYARLIPSGFIITPSIVLVRTELEIENSPTNNEQIISELVTTLVANLLTYSLGVIALIRAPIPPEPS